MPEVPTSSKHGEKGEETHDLMLRFSLLCLPVFALGHVVLVFCTCTISSISSQGTHRRKVGKISPTRYKDERQMRDHADKQTWLQVRHTDHSDTMCEILGRGLPTGFPPNPPTSAPVSTTSCRDTNGLLSDHATCCSTVPGPTLLPTQPKWCRPR